MLMLLAKALHIIAVISWMAGLLYLPRLFVYHAECGEDDKVGRERFTVMERRLYKTIMGPAMAVSVLLGFGLLYWYKVGGWIVAKIVLVFLLIAFHVWCGRQIKRLEAGEGRTARAYRMWNEAPAVVMAAIVLLVVLKPF